MTRPALVVDLGGRRYRVERPFHAPGQGTVSDVAVAVDGTVHALLRRDPLVDQYGPGVITLSSDGAVLAQWGEEIADAHMLAASRDGTVYIVDRDAHEIITFRDGLRVGGLGTRNSPFGPFNHPTGVAVAPEGSIYVCEGYAGHSVYRFTPDGTEIARWGSYGTGPGEFRNAHAVWVRQDGSVVVVDRENDRLQVFDPEGELLHIWGGFVKPLDVWGDLEGCLYVSDFTPSLTMLDVDGIRVGRCRPVLNVAHGLSGAPDGTIYFAEPAPSRISRIVPLN